MTLMSSTGALWSANELNEDSSKEISFYTKKKQTCLDWPEDEYINAQ